MYISRLYKHKGQTVFWHDRNGSFFPRDGDETVGSSAQEGIIVIQITKVQG